MVIYTSVKNGPLEKGLNSHAFHACTHGFESRTGYHLTKQPLSKDGGFFHRFSLKMNSKKRIKKNKICGCILEIKMLEYMSLL